MVFTVWQQIASISLKRIEQWQIKIFHFLQQDRSQNASLWLIILSNLQFTISLLHMQKKWTCHWFQILAQNKHFKTNRRADDLMFLTLESMKVIPSRCPARIPTWCGSDSRRVRRSHIYRDRRNLFYETILVFESDCFWTPF